MLPYLFYLKVEARDMFWTPGDLPVSTVTTDGILLRLGMTSGRHKEGHKNAKNTGTS